MDKEPNGYKCLRCDADLFGQRRKWCDSLCHNRAKNNTKQTLEEHRASLDAKESNKFWCECCHKQFKQRQSGTNKKAGHKVRFCSMTCRVKQAEVLRVERTAIKRLWTKNQQLAKRPQPKTIKVFACLTCKAQRLEKEGRWSKYCSDACKPKPKPCKPNKNLESFKRNKKAWRLKRKALERGATVAQQFHPFEVFDRDGWKCQICGIKTPKELRGSYKPNAPELDHIVPISKGGQHTMTNAQTSCRSCNGAKSNKDSRGQMGLFTGLIHPRGAIRP